jgi:hypothetical protein
MASFCREAHFQACSLLELSSLRNSWAFRERKTLGNRREDSSSASVENLNGRESLCSLRDFAAKSTLATSMPLPIGIDGSRVRCGADFPGILASVPILQCTFPPLRSKSVSPSVHLPAHSSRRVLTFQGKSCSSFHFMYRLFSRKKGMV